MKGKWKKGTVIVCVLALAIIGLAVELYSLMKVDTGAILLDYRKTAQAFALADDQLKNRKEQMAGREIIRELGQETYWYVRQTERLTRPLLISDRWYAHDLENFLFDCIAAEEQTDEETAAFAKKIGEVAAELDKIKWDELDALTDGGSWLEWHIQKREALAALQHVEDILADYENDLTGR